ncbi:MAG: hypothetical protein HC905_20210 [Bacteroidales bacterium]|nr:hypothetical protein [Bacteroidales bacterium]
MANQKGIIKIEGTVGGMTFYKKDGQYLVKEKSSISAAKIANDPNFARTRENNAEFGAAGTSGKLLRDSLRSLMMTASDSLVTSRVTTLMHDVMKMDVTSPRGQRKPAVGIGTVNGRTLLKGFNFNINAILGTVLYKPFAVAPATGVITIAGLVPLTDIAFPAGATHVSLSGAMANINFATGVADVRLTNVLNLANNAPSTAVTLTPTAVAAGTGTRLFLLKVEFFQLVNGIQYPMKNGSYNALSIIETA